MRTKLYGRARPPGESYIFAAMLVKCGRSCLSRHIAQLRACAPVLHATAPCHWPLPPCNFHGSGHFLFRHAARQICTQRSAFRSTFFASLHVATWRRNARECRMCSFHFCFIALRLERNGGGDGTGGIFVAKGKYSCSSCFVRSKKNLVKGDFSKFSSPCEKEFYYKVFWKKNPFGFNPVSRLLFARGW